jgi:glycosyltransferase involved in cell wall biosynthesis
MKILHLIAGELNGGAARGAYWLHKALCDLGVDSTVLTNAKDNLGDESVISLTTSTLGKMKFSILYRLGRMPLKLYRDRRPLIFSTGFDGIDITRHPSYASADIVHLHWVNGLVNSKALGKVKKPIVWTLRDMWPFTGGCHQSLECVRFTEGCGYCPQLGSARGRDLSRFILRRKQAYLPKNVRIVGVSRWMSDCATKSAVLGGCQVTTISNNIDTEQFTPLAKTLAREALGLDENQKIVLVGALDVASVYKGFDLFLEALNSLSKENLRVVFFGKSRGDIPESLGVPVTNLGFFSDVIALRLAYSAADVFVAPSRADAFGKTLVEAMSCGTPVVCFNATGPRDIVEHQVSGYMAEPFSPSDLAKGIQWVLDQPGKEYADMCRNARARAQQCFDSRVVAKEYLALYQEALGSGID